ncbi:MAG: CPBP family intramembrane metalloprotease [Lachnospiraceae bacterium]|nr:CPBP family intramembrane metalloprotease [Lachnospiraceae bacterium]
MAFTFLSAVFTALFLNVAVSLLQSYFPDAPLFRTPDITYGTAGASTPVFLAQILTLGVLQPFLEEVVFRFFLFYRLLPYLLRNYSRFNKEDRKGPLLLSAVLSSLFFGIYHGNLMQGIYAFLMGLFLCYTYEKHAGLLSSFALHVSLNILMLFLVHYRVYPILCTPLWCAAFLALSVAGIFALLRLPEDRI